MSTVVEALWGVIDGGGLSGKDELLAVFGVLGDAYEDEGDEGMARVCHWLREARCYPSFHSLQYDAQGLPDCEWRWYRATDDLSTGWWLSRDVFVSLLGSKSARTSFSPGDRYVAYSTRRKAVEALRVIPAVLAGSF